MKFIANLNIYIFFKCANKICPIGKQDLIIGKQDLIIGKQDLIIEFVIVCTLKKDVNI
jgi:hypothetical protein